MAIQIAYLDSLTGLSKEAAYHRVKDVRISNGNAIQIDVGIYGSSELCDHGYGKLITEIISHIVRNDDGQGTAYAALLDGSLLPNAYTYLLTLPEYVGGTSC